MVGMESRGVDSELQNAANRRTQIRPGGSFPPVEPRQKSTLERAFVFLFPSGVLIVLIAVILSEMRAGNEGARESSCRNNLRQLRISCEAYSQDFDERFPACGNWTRAIYPYLKSEVPFRCPSALGPGTDYGLNANLGSISPERLDNAAAVVLLFDASNGGQCGSAANADPRHRGGSNIVFADGRGKWMVESTVPSLQWTPTLKPQDIIPQERRRRFQ